jgi:hypothetical protein
MSCSVHHKYTVSPGQIQQRFLATGKVVVFGPEKEGVFAEELFSARTATTNSDRRKPTQGEPPSSGRRGGSGGH